MNQGKLDEAKVLFTNVLTIDPYREEAHVNLGILFDLTNDTPSAVREYRATLEKNPVNTVASNNLAWILATDKKPENRNGAEAVKLAEQACKNLSSKEPMFLATLAAAYAEVGRFKDALRVARQGLQIAKDAKADQPMLRLQDSIQCYELGLPYREVNGS